MISMDKMMYKIEQDLDQLRSQLGEKPMFAEEIVETTNWSEEKTRIYLYRLTEVKEIARDNDGKYYIS